MKKQIKFIILIFILLFLKIMQAQNETQNWHFGIRAAISFSNNPPVAVNNSSIFSQGGASISDTNGNLLFYSSGDTIWNKQHVVMANGAGLLGSKGPQSALIVKQPGNSSIYYVFTVGYFQYPTTLHYSIVDMSLAAGMGSVTTKNVYLYGPSTAKQAAVKHCNGIDVWALSHDWNTNNFRAYLVTATGINTVAINSPVGSIITSTSTVPGPYPLVSFSGLMKISPTGKKIAMANHTHSNSIELYDFDNVTGIVSNQVILPTNDNLEFGCEFSPDGTKLYTTKDNFFNPNFVGGLYQWDLCAGSNQAIAASMLALSTTTISKLGLQLAANGKIYVNRNSDNNLGVINNPNLAGAACGFSESVIPISPGKCGFSLPMFMSSYFKQVLLPFTASVTCQNVDFSFSTNAQLSCAVNGYSIISKSWDFGDANSGALNTSINFNPSHFYSATGTYTAQLIINYPCRADTLKQIITITTANPSFAVSIPTVMCKGETYTVSASNPVNTYSWTSYTTPSLSPPGVISNSIIISPTTTTNYFVTASNTLTACKTTSMFTINVNKCLGLVDLADGESMRVFPNPSTGIFTIQTSTKIRIKVQNSLGSIFLEDLMDNQNSSIDLSAYPNGLYLLTIFENERSRSFKLLKME